MWLDKVPHRVKYDNVRDFPMSWTERDELVQTYDAYLKAYAAFISHNTDETLIHLIGHYARWSSVMHKLDRKYGGKK